MTKGDDTRRQILALSADLFSKQGYSGTSMSDIMRVTGLEKGGIYNHFKNKEALALEAYEYAAAQVQERMSEMVYAHKHAADRLIAMIDAMRLNLDDPIVAGGCPTMNLAIDSDDTHPEMRSRAAGTFNRWMYMIRRICEKGIERGELIPQTNIDEVASLLITSLEGALMVSKATGDAGHMERVCGVLRAYIHTRRQS